MHRLTSFSALFLAIVLALQGTAQTVCEAVCLGVAESGSSSAITSPPVPQCHSVQQPNGTPSASLVPRDGECRHADVAQSFGAERMLLRPERCATALPRSISAPLHDTLAHVPFTDLSHAPPGNDGDAVAPLRL
jgi:hypothetical protein